MPPALFHAFRPAGETRQYPPRYVTKFRLTYLSCALSFRQTYHAA